MKPTIDCATCNMDGLDENEDFRCKWRYPKPVITIEDNRCYHVVEIDKVYDRAVMRSEIMSIMVESSLTKEELVEIRDYVKGKISEG